jgi:uncharacterized protein YneF (UPF0154 family)
MDRVLHIILVIVGMIVGAAGMYIGYPYIKK